MAPPMAAAAKPFFLPYLPPPLPQRLSLPTTSTTPSLSTTPFLGTPLVHSTAAAAGRRRFSPTIAAAVKRRKEQPFDNVIQRDKKLKLVLKIRKILVAQPERTMSLKSLGRYRRDLGLARKRRFIALLRRFPAVFQILEEGAYSLKFRLTPDAERNYLDELQARAEMEASVVANLRKLLMMSLEKRILLEKIAHLKSDLGLPPDFKDTVCKRYPQYFKLVATDRGPALELTCWDAALAVSAAEAGEAESRRREVEERNLIIDRPPRFNRVKLPRGLCLSKGETRRINQFRDLPYISPYSYFSDLKAGSLEKEKHACGVVHELLSLTVEKRTLVDHLTHFREEFRFSQQLRGMLIRHPDMFYVSLKGDRDSVFLREAYRDSQLIEKDKLLLVKEKLRALVAVPRFSPRRGRPAEAVAGGSGREGSDEWSDVERFEPAGMDEEFDDNEEFDDGNEEDEWSDDEEEGDEVPPDFEDGDFGFEKGKVAIGGVGKLAQVKEKEELVPVFADGRPRERW